MNKYKERNISDAFKDIIENLKLINNKKIIEFEDIIYIQFIFDLLTHIYTFGKSEYVYEKIGEICLRYDYVPTVFSIYDIKLVL